MMSKKFSLLFCFLALYLTGCSLLTNGPVVTPTLSPLDPTAIVQTVYAQLTQNAPPTPTLQLETPTLASSPTPEFSVTPSLSPTITLTPTPSVPMISATINTNCRAGPGVVYPVIGYLLVGQSVQVTGRLANNSWWVIQHPDRAGQVCWVWNQTTVVSGDTASLPAATPPPTPTPTNTATITKTATVTNTSPPTNTPTPTP